MSNYSDEDYAHINKGDATWTLSGIAGVFILVAIALICLLKN